MWLKVEKAEFINNLIEIAHKIGENISENEANKFFSYMNLLLEWNKNINLTAIIEEKEIIINTKIKHWPALFCG